MSTVAHVSLEHYENMVEEGAFSGPFQKLLELLRGEIVEMGPIGSEHADTIDRLNELSTSATAHQSIRVRVQNPIRIPASEDAVHPLALPEASLRPL